MVATYKQYASIADQVVVNWTTLPSTRGAETLTQWCIENSIVFPIPKWDKTETHFIGWEFVDKSRIIFDEFDIPHKVS